MHRQPVKNWVNVYNNRVTQSQKYNNSVNKIKATTTTTSFPYQETDPERNAPRTQWLTIERHNRTCANCRVCVQFCFVCRLLVFLPNFVVVVEHMKFWGNHSFWPSKIADIDRDGWNITCRWCQDSYIFPRDNIFPQCCALRENISPWEISHVSSPKRDISWSSQSISI